MLWNTALATENPDPASSHKKPVEAPWAMFGSTSTAVGGVLDVAPAGGDVSVVHAGQGVLIEPPKKDSFQNAA